MTNRYKSSASTHADGCWSWGHGHYECAVREIEHLQAEVERLRTEVERFRTDGASAVRWAPGSAYWSEVLVELFGPDARKGIDVLETRWRKELERADKLAEALKAENEALRAMEAADAAPQQPAATSETVNVIGMPEFDGLLDHIYEHGTAAEDVIEKANAFARAVIARYAPQQPAAVAQPLTDEALLRQVLEVLSHTHQKALDHAIKSRILEGIVFAEIFQDLDFVVAALRERLEKGMEQKA